MLLYTHDRFLEHDTGAHPENATRLRHITDQLKKTRLIEACRCPTWEPVSPERLARIHHRQYADEVKQFCERGGGRIEVDTVVSRASYDVALLAAGAACDATGRVLRGDDRQALCLVRPPGHHALTASAMGFCLFNNVAIAAQVAIVEFRLQRVLIIDWDVHHGNGTQDAFWRDPQVAFLSIHRFPFYPGTGDHHETGAGPGLGTKLNLPVAFGTPRKDYLALFQGELDKFADKLKPELVIISAGFDAHRTDPVGSLGLETEDFETISNIVLDVAAAHAGGKVVSVLEGGYNPQILAHCVELHLRQMLAREKALQGK
jgi:acetoin utilization deacetylase AcuC-like enzyme